MPPTLHNNNFDELSVVRAVTSLSRAGVRSPLNVERVKQWVKQFVTKEEKALAWLILRNLIYRTNEQLLSSMRQALKLATIHFVTKHNRQDSVTWGDALKGDAGLTFLCGPPSLATSGSPTTPGKSGELITRLINQRYRIGKHFPSDITVLEPDERFIVVDDGTYTGVQLVNFLRNWDIDFSKQRVAIAVAIAHEHAYEYIKQEFPNVPLFFGELLTPETCFKSLCQKWQDTQQWIYDKSPLEIYEDVYKRNQPFEKGSGANGYGDIGALVAFEHGVPDDSIQLLWDTSQNWKPLIDRGV